MDPRPWGFLGRFEGGGTPGSLAIGLARAVGELRRASRTDPLRAGEGAVLLCERLPAALAGVEDPVGTLAAALVRSIDAIAPLIAAGPTARRAVWLERLWARVLADEAGHLRRLAEHWGARAGPLAGAWAGRLLPAAREEVGTAASIACLASQVASGAYAAALELLASRSIAVWPERQFGVLALAATGRIDEALAYAADSNPLGHRHAQDIARMCERVLLAGGRREAAYRGFAAAAHARQNCRQTFEALRRAYPERGAGELLADLLAASPGQEGRWFATACALRFHGLAAEIAGRSPCDPRTLVRAGARALETDPAFAGEVAVAALRTGSQARLRATLRVLCEQPHPSAQWVHGLLARELE